MGVPTENSVLAAFIDVAALDQMLSRSMSSVVISLLLTLRSSVRSRAMLHVEITPHESHDSSLPQRKLDEPVRTLQVWQRTAGVDEIVELRTRNWNARHDAADPPRLLVEVPDELATGYLPL